MRSTFRSAILGAVGIVVVSAALGLIVNSVASQGIPLAPPPVSSKAPRIPFEKAWEAHDNADAAFVDARPIEEYETGHIKGAINVPMLERTRHLETLLKQIPSTSQVVVYCDGEECEASDKVASWMIAEGWRNVTVLGEGFGAWRDSGLAVAEGKKP